MGVSSNIFILSVIILISWARFIAPEVSEVSSGEEEHEDGGDKDEAQELVEDGPVTTEETRETVAASETSDTVVKPKSSGLVEKLAKLLLILPNFVFAVLGLALVLSGAYLQIAHKESFNFIENVPTPILLIAVGSSVFLVSFIACRGAGRSSTFLLNFYSFAMVFIIVAEVACIVLSFVYVDNVAAGN